MASSVSVSTRGGRSPARAGAKAKGARPSESVREVCLLGARPNPAPASSAGAWSEGDRVTWSGRVYRVEATEAGPSAFYAHLETAGG